MFEFKDQGLISQQQYDNITRLLQTPLDEQDRQYSLHRSDGETDIAIIDSKEFIQDRLFSDEIKHEFLELDIDETWAGEEWLSQDEQINDIQFDLFNEGQISVDEL